MLARNHGSSVPSVPTANALFLAVGPLLVPLLLSALSASAQDRPAGVLASSASRLTELPATLEGVPVLGATPTDASPSWWQVRFNDGVWLIDRELAGMGVRAPSISDRSYQSEQVGSLLASVSALPAAQQAALREGSAIPLGALSPESREALAALSGGGSFADGIRQSGPDSPGFIQCGLYPTAWFSYLEGERGFASSLAVSLGSSDRGSSGIVRRRGPGPVVAAPAPAAGAKSTVAIEAGTGLTLRDIGRSLSQQLGAEVVVDDWYADCAVAGASTKCEVDSGGADSLLSPGVVIRRVDDLWFVTLNTLPWRQARPEDPATTAAVAALVGFWRGAARGRIADDLFGAGRREDDPGLGPGDPWPETVGDFPMAAFLAGNSILVRDLTPAQRDQVGGQVTTQGFSLGDDTEFRLVPGVRLLVEAMTQQETNEVRAGPDGSATITKVTRETPTRTYHTVP